MNLKELFPNASESLLSVNTHLVHTGSIAPPHGKGGSKKCPKWSLEQDAFLRYAYENGGKELNMLALSACLGRSEAAIQCRSHELRIPSPIGRGNKRKPQAKPLPLSRDEQRQRRSAAMKLRHSQRAHPMLGKPVPQSVRDKISKTNTGRIIKPESVLAGLKTRQLNGTLSPPRPHGSWKAGWREIGGKRIYARSRWEANYARYLEFLKQSGEIIEWEHEPHTFWFDRIKRGCRSYLPDFRVTLQNGIEYHECKGWMDARSITKLKRMKRYHPTVTLILRNAQWFRSNRLKLRGMIDGWEDGKCS